MMHTAHSGIPCPGRSKWHSALQWQYYRLSYVTAQPVQAHLFSSGAAHNPDQYGASQGYASLLLARMGTVCTAVGPVCYQAGSVPTIPQPGTGSSEHGTELSGPTCVQNRDSSNDKP